jgi:hypothetical protein
MAQGQRMNSKAMKSRNAAKSGNKKMAKKSSPMTKSHARATTKGLRSQAKRLMKSNPLRMLLGAAATALVAVKLKQRFA